MTDEHGSRPRPGRAAARARRRYVPGGRAAYPSTVLMTAVPARVAGVPRDRAASRRRAPTSRSNAAVLAAARIAGVTEAYRVGGAQAIAALAYGTETIRRVDKIVGPGQHLRRARQEPGLRRGRHRHDRGAERGASSSPTRGADPACVAADLLAQAEHDPMARAVLLTPSARADRRASRPSSSASSRRCRAATIAQQRARGQRRARADAEPRGGGGRGQRARARAPRAPGRRAAALARLACAPRARCSSGRYTPEVVGDYVAGPNHVLPTGGTARFASALSTEDFVKRVERHRVLAAGASRRRCRTWRRWPGSRDSHGHGRGRGRARSDGRERMKRAARATEPERRRGRARVERNTKETQIALQLDIDGAGARKVDDRHPVLQPHAGGVGEARADGPHRRRQRRSRGGSPPHGRGRRHLPRPGVPRGARRQARHRALRRVVPADGRGAGARRGRPLGAAVPRLQRAACQRTRVVELRPRPAAGVLPRVRVQRRDHAARQHALRREPAPHRRGDLQGGRPRARRGHAPQSAHRRHAALDEGRLCDRRRRLRPGQSRQRGEGASSASACRRVVTEDPQRRRRRGGGGAARRRRLPRRDGQPRARCGLLEPLRALPRRAAGPSSASASAFSSCSPRARSSARARGST